MEEDVSELHWSSRRRLALALIGISIAGSGVAITAHSLLGTSPISSIPYVASCIWPRLTFGTTTFILNALFFAFQLCVYRKSFPKSQWLQIPAVAWFGFCIDSVGYFCSFISLDYYWFKIFEVFLGCAVLGFGIVLELAADYVYLPGEGMVTTLNLFAKVRFGTLKIIFDFCQAIVAAGISYVVLDRIEGVREGTLISAFMVGWFIKRFKRIGDAAKKTTYVKIKDDAKSRGTAD